MGELRDRMVRDMDVRNFSGRTVEAYVAGVRGLAKYYHRSPDQLSDAEVQRYLLYLGEERQLSTSTRNQIRCALKFLYEVTLRRPQAALAVPPLRQAQKLPEILSRAEVERIVAATRTRRERVLLMATYGGGLRVSEVVALRPGDLDAERGVIRVEHGKGKKDRYTVLAERLVRDVAQDDAVYGRPEHWVFPQRAEATRHLDASSAQKIDTTAKRRAGIAQVGGIQAMRHAVATHRLEAGVDLPTLGRMLGHTSVSTTMRYLHTTTKRVAAQIAPLDRLLLGPAALPDIPLPQSAGMALPSPLAVAAAAAAESAGRPPFEVADVVRAYGPQSLRPSPTSPEQRRVLRALAACRTAALGGHVEQCEQCAYPRIAYNSCRNRHCPKCHGKERAQWMAAEQALLLPVPYFHVVFTLPHALNPLIRTNRRRLYALLFRCAARTLRTFARDPRHLGAELAITMVLHTWGQTLEEHFHVHCVVSGGGLSLDGSAWISLPTGKQQRRRPFLFPVKALSAVFRGKYIAARKRARNTGNLHFAGQRAALADPVHWQTWLDALAQTDWVVYCKRPFGGPAQVLKYLSRYTHRVAISNHRMLFVGNGVVRFSYRDSADHDCRKEMTLPATEFLRRFLLQHLVPKGFRRIRHYGITANRQRQRQLQRARARLGVGQLAPTATDTPPPPAAADTTRSAPDSPAKPCPRCGGPLRIIELLPPTRIDFLAAPAAPDTS